MVTLNTASIYDEGTVRSYFKEKGYIFLEDPFQLNIVGFRNLEGESNTFCDYLGVFYKNFTKPLKIFCKITTRPGVPYLLKPLLAKGCAIMVPGQYLKAYSLGIFKGKYEALIQTSPIKVFRDSNLDAIYDESYHTVEEGMFGIDIHKAAVFSSIVNLNSAGCQVFQSAICFDEFISLCERSRTYAKASGFNYTLVEY